MLKIVGLTQILTTFGMHRDAMKVQYVLSNKEYLTKKQEIFACVENSSEYSFYRYLNSQHCLQYYLTNPIPVMFQKCIFKIRMSSHNLAVETGRFSRTNRIQRKCIY